MYGMYNDKAIRFNSGNIVYRRRHTAARKLGQRREGTVDSELVAPQHRNGRRHTVSRLRVHTYT